MYIVYTMYLVVLVIICSYLRIRLCKVQYYKYFVQRFTARNLLSARDCESWKMKIGNSIRLMYAAA